MNINEVNKSKYFVVDDKRICTLLKRMTQQFFYKYDKPDGTKAYSFKRTEKLEMAYQLIKKAEQMDILNLK